MTKARQYQRKYKQEEYRTWNHFVISLLYLCVRRRGEYVSDSKEVITY